MAKIGVNTKTEIPRKIDCAFVIVDNKPHLNSQGVKYLSNWVASLLLVTTNKNHPAFNLAPDLGNVTVIPYEEQINFDDLFQRLKTEFGFGQMTIQSGGTMNASLLRQGLIDHISVVVAPLLIGGQNTASLVDGDSLKTDSDLLKTRPLKLIACNQLEHSYINLRYDVVNS